MAYCLYIGWQIQAALIGFVIEKAVTKRHEIKFFRNLTDFVKRVFASRTAWNFFFVHLAVLTIALIQKGSIQQIHFEDEILLFKILIITNYFASTITDILLFPINILLLSEDVKINSLILITYIFWQIQWALIGYGIEKLLRSNKHK